MPSFPQDVNGLHFYYGISNYKLLDGSYTLKRLKSGSDGLNYAAGDRYINTAFYLEAALEYSRMFKEKHSVNGLFVYTMREAKQSNPYITSLQLSLPNRNIGFAGRMAYNYDYRYMLELNFGYNGSERFAKNNRWVFSLLLAQDGCYLTKSSLSLYVAYLTSLRLRLLMVWQVMIRLVIMKIVFIICQM